MKKILIFLAAALMLLASVSCKKENLLNHLEGTKWVDAYGDIIEVVSFEDHNSFTFYTIDESSGEITEALNCKIVEYQSDRLLFKFDPPFEDSKYHIIGGVVMLEGDKLLLILTNDTWTVYESGGMRAYYSRNDKFDLSKYKYSVE